MWLDPDRYGASKSTKRVVLHAPKYEIKEKRAAVETSEDLRREILVHGVL